MACDHSSSNSLCSDCVAKANKARQEKLDREKGKAPVEPFTDAEREAKGFKKRR